MSRTLRLLALVMLAVILQTNIAMHIRIANVAPDFMILILVMLSEGYGSFGGFCAGALMGLFYDASVGTVLAINLVSYTFIGYIVPVMKSAMDNRLHRIGHRKIIILMTITFVVVALREILDIGYLFLIGAEQSTVTILRMFICCFYTAALIIPSSAVLYLFTRKRRVTSDRENSFY